MRYATSLTFVALAIVAARADLIVESGDAGDTPATAQTTASIVTAIEGDLSSADDADMYAVYVDDPLSFSATTDGLIGGVWDTQLFLFDSQGYGVSANDDIANGTGPYNPRSLLAAGGDFHPPTAGLYYLAISGWDRDPHSLAGPIFLDDSIFVGTVGPTHVGGGQPIIGWDGDGDRNGGTGAYRIRLTGSQLASIPESGTLALLLAGFLVWTLRRAAFAARG